MMTSIALPVSASGSYGALELKHDYRKHMLFAVVIAATLHLGIVGALLLYQASLPVPVEPDIIIIVVDGETTVDPPPPMTYKTPEFQYEETLAELPSGTPVAMPDAEVAEDPHIPTRLERAQVSAVAAQGSRIDDGTPVVVKSPVIDDWPEPSAFVAVEEQPVAIHFETPAFPEMAELTGQSGSVWIQALVDTQGRVRDANVLKPSGSNVGFEEAALKAAFENVYRPAIQNGRPVPVWITYRVDFKLR